MCNLCVVIKIAKDGNAKKLPNLTFVEGVSWVCYMPGAILRAVHTLTHSALTILEFLNSSTDYREDKELAYNQSVSDKAQFQT